MKKFFCFFILVFAGISAVGQDIVYDTKENIPYYDKSQYDADRYMADLCVLDVYYPKTSKGFATIIWFHGGSLTSGKKEIPQELKDKGYCIIGVGYRLSPNVKCPTYIEDAAAAVAWVYKNINTYGGDQKLIFLSGHSAGGYLDLMVGLDKKWLEKYNIDANEIAGLIPFSPQTITHFTVRKERGISSKQPVVDEYSPLFWVRRDAPSLLLITGDKELELFGRYEENAYFLRMMKINGHKANRLLELQGYNHDMCKPAYPLLLAEVNRIIKEKK